MNIFFRINLSLGTHVFLAYLLVSSLCAWTNWYMYLHHFYTEEKLKTRKSSCVNARGIPPAVYWVLLLLSYLGTPPSWPGRWGTQLGGVPTWVHPPGWAPPPGKVTLGRVPPQLGTPRQGTPPPWQGTSPWCLSHGILGNVAKHYGIWVPPPPVDRQIDGRTDTCQNITFPSYYVRGR